MRPADVSPETRGKQEGGGMMTTSPITTVNPFAHATPVANASDGNHGQPAGITANDFLTLLVTEMKNQDPTAQTDPNEYINQLVNVNSLQQLISINETLTGAFGSSNYSAYAQPATQTA